MKTYIIYIATLLAALALPANGQTASTDTKAAPDAPAMPYKLSLVTIGGNNGTVKVEDNVPNGGGMIVVGKDTLIYGAPASSNATTVKLTVTPNTGYIIRSGYPKGYKTGDTRPENALSGNSPYTFKMPYFPLTVEVAYANQLKEQTTQVITLKEKTESVAQVISKLPAYIHFTLTSGRKDSLKVADSSGWKYEKDKNGGKEYATTPGADHLFTFTLAALPDSLIDATPTSLLTGTVKVANMAEPLKPNSDSDKITILPGTGDNLSSKEGNQGTEAPFNGTIKDATVKELEISKDVKDATLTLSGVTVTGNSSSTTSTTTIKGGATADEGAKLTLRLEGTNNLGELKIEQNATVTLDKAEGASLGTTTISNGGTFRDSTATITKVEGTGKLDINGNLAGGGTVTTGTPITLTATTNDKAGTTTFVWQKKNTDGSYTEIVRRNYDENGSPVTRSTTGIIDRYNPATSSTGTTKYRCLIERTVTTSGGGGAPQTATTLLSTQPAQVVVRSGGNPDPGPGPTPTPDPTPDPSPASYTVTLPAATGYVTNPAAGQHKVEEGEDFTFTLTPAKGYDTPTVTTSRNETLTPQKADGTYVIPNVKENITVSITAHPTGNAEWTDSAFRIWCTPGTVHLYIPEATTVNIYNLSGNLQKSLQAPEGNSQYNLPSGFYLIIAGNRQQKVVVP